MFTTQFHVKEQGTAKPIHRRHRRQDKSVSKKVLDIDRRFIDVISALKVISTQRSRRYAEGRRESRRPIRESRHLHAYGVLQKTSSGALRTFKRFAASCYSGVPEFFGLGGLREKKVFCPGNTLPRYCPGNSRIYYRSAKQIRPASKRSRSSGANRRRGY